VAGVETAYYLIHSMHKGKRGATDFHRRDLEAAANFGRVAKAAGVERIIYLGGLGATESDLSLHLRSRQKTGNKLREAGVPVTEFRAAIIVGSGSVSFEMIRYLTEWLPIMFCPHWIKSRVQPISIRNVLDYLVAALRTPESTGRIIEIGGKDVLTYAAMLLGYAEVRKLRRILLPVPVVTPKLFSHWVHWLTPISMEMARPLLEGLRNEVIVRDDSALRLFPDIRLFDYKTAVERALHRLETGEVLTAWSDALITSQGDTPAVEFSTRNGMHMDRRQHVVSASPRTIFQVFSSLGGKRGWPFLNWIWRLRGIIDQVVGGVGFRRGRRDPNNLRIGDALDFWRVEAVDPGRLVRLRAEMKVPGLAWLQFEAQARSEKESFLIQTAFFAPRGFFGLLYWYLLYPIHRYIFSGTVRRIARRAEASARSPGRPI